MYYNDNNPEQLSEQMTNKEIAHIFSRIADALEMKGENVFRVRAYRTAAQNIKGLARQLSDVYALDPEKIDSVQGIGKDLKAKIIEMIETGSLTYYKELMDEFPEGFLDMLDIAGLGPKKLIKLRDELEIENIVDLEVACRKGRLEDIEGMGAKTQEKLLDAIQYYRRSEGRMLLPDAYEYSDEILEYLEGSELFKKLERAGSLRRGCETIGDLDVLAVAENAEEAMDYFIKYPKVKNVIAHGATKSSILLKDGPQIDLRIVADESFGSALQYFTGSKEHNVEVRKIAKKKGFKVSEYGVFKLSAKGKKEKYVAGKTEEEVYKALGMDWVAPELRASRGEVLAALRGKLPKDLLDLSDIKGDLHMHTNATDGRASVEDLACAAKAKGYKYIGITDHTKNVRVANGMDEKRLIKHIDKIRKIDSKTKGIKILAGAEVDILGDGKLDIEDEVLAELDIVIAAVHSKFSLPKDKQTARILKALDNKYVNALAHPSGRLIITRKALELDLDKIFRKAARNNVFLEINTHGQRIDLNDVNCMRAKELGVRMVINTDAHEVSHMDQMKYGVITAKRGWLEKKDILNTYALAEVKKMLKK